MQEGHESGPSAATPAAETEWSFGSFLVVRKNRSACIHWLFGLAQHIEVRWEDTDARVPLLQLLRECLESLADHAHADCRELAALAPRMLHTLEFTERHFLNLMLPIERRHSKGLRDHEFIVHTQDRPQPPRGSDADGPGASEGDGEGLSSSCAPAGGRMRLTVILDHLRSAFNVGAIFRTADCLGVEKLLLCGYTATPADASVQRTTLGAHACVAWE